MRDDGDRHHGGEHEFDRDQRQRAHLGLELARRRRPAGGVESGIASGVGGTPTFFVGGVRHSGAFDAQSLIAALQR